MESNITFDELQDESLKLNDNPIFSNQVFLDIVKAEYIGVQSMTLSDLTEGFNELYVVTYSSGIGFICDMLSRFDKAEIVFGFEDVISYNLQEIISLQSKTIERLRTESNNHKLDLLTRIDNGTLKLYVAKEKLSHEKIYLLKSNDGRKRVITGSANMSRAAFSGKQQENIICFDGEEAYGWYLSCFERLKACSGNEISKQALQIGNSSENLCDLPIAEELKVKKVLLIEKDHHVTQDVTFALDVKKLAQKVTGFMPKQDKKGRIMLNPEQLTETRRRILDGISLEKDARKEYPELLINFDSSEVHLNGEKMNLQPTSDEIENDVALFLEYMEGYGKFHGDFTGLQYKYYAFAVWFFSTPFMAMMRHTAYNYNQSSMQYPVFGILYGQSKAGKTTFLETLLKLMIGQKTKLSAPDFTRSSIDGLRKSVKGAPIIVDDLTQSRFSQHGIETIKNDDFGVVDNLISYPAVVISANEDIKAFAPEVVRRAVICNVKAGLKNTELMKTSIVRKVQKNIGTAFYREYLRRMTIAIPDMIDELKEDQTDSAPDLLNVSSKIIYEIISEHSNFKLPEYIRVVSIDDYFNEKVTGSQVIKKIKEAWQVNQKAFEVDRKLSRLTYNAGETWEADRIIKELPEDLEPHKSRELVIMKLDKAIEFFEIDFKKQSIFQTWINKGK